MIGACVTTCGGFLFTTDQSSRYLATKEGWSNQYVYVKAVTNITLALNLESFMASKTIFKFKQGDSLNLGSTVSDTLSPAAVSTAATVVIEQTAYDALLIADPIDQPAIDAQLIVLNNAIAAYDAAIIVDISTWTITSQVRWRGKLIANLTVNITDGVNGAFAITALPIVTQLWDPREYDCDIQFVRPSVGTTSSQTFIIDVEKDVTYV